MVIEKEAVESPAVMKCSECNHTYHEECLKGKGTLGVLPDTWFYGVSCQSVIPDSVTTLVQYLGHMRQSYHTNAGVVTQTPSSHSALPPIPRQVESTPGTTVKKSQISQSA